MTQTHLQISRIDPVTSPSLAVLAQSQRSKGTSQNGASKCLMVFFKKYNTGAKPLIVWAPVSKFIFGDS